MLQSHCRRSVMREGAGEEREIESKGVVEWLAFMLPTWEAPYSDTGTETVYGDANV